MSVGAALYVIVGGLDAGDPFSAFEAAQPHLAEVYSRIERVADLADCGPRQFRRAYRPDLDRVLYDFTGIRAPGWARDMMSEAPGAILLSAHPPRFEDEGSTPRAQRRYAAAFRAPAAATVAGLDARPPSAEFIVPRPAFDMPQATPRYDAAIIAPMDTITALYEALLAVRDTASQIVVATPNVQIGRVRGLITLLSLSETVDVRSSERGDDVAAVVAEARSIIDLTPGWTGLSEAGFAAKLLGIPLVRITQPEAVTSRTASFLARREGVNADAGKQFASKRSLGTTSQSLLKLIESARRRAVKPAAA